MNNSTSTSHLTCVIEAIALAKHNSNSSSEELKAQLLAKGYDDSATIHAVNALSAQRPLAI
ncbi:hypothetical protein [Alteromonas sp. S167]|jgi:hypothetical protein|uniref:hypothetical protein n=1 Tax=Alteromonas sp. S167 TaxID=3117402 RepID=UPI002FE17E7F|tara:strand:- start:397 stop:579 length:183 start_codon:yes stop_codon:yes gene_type:complete